MKVSVWDTYIKRQDGLIMHFDVLVDSKLSDETQVFKYGRDYLKGKTFQVEKLTAKECVFCHIEEAEEIMKNEIDAKGYYIIEMENCH